MSFSGLKLWINILSISKKEVGESAIQSLWLSCYVLGAALGKIFLDMYSHVWLIKSAGEVPWIWVSKVITKKDGIGDSTTG